MIPLPAVLVVDLDELALVAVASIFAGRIDPESPEESLRTEDGAADEGREGEDPDDGEQLDSEGGGHGGFLVSHGASPD